MHVNPKVLLRTISCQGFNLNQPGDRLTIQANLQTVISNLSMTILLNCYRHSDPFFFFLNFVTFNYTQDRNQLKMGVCLSKNINKLGIDTFDVMLFYSTLARLIFTNTSVFEALMAVDTIGNYSK